jgi:hypothetical protein
MSDTPNEIHPRCKNLCCKAMLVYGEDFESDPDYQAGMMSFWCTLTAKSQGPDGEHVALELCRDPQRTCYQAY